MLQENNTILFSSKKPIPFASSLSLCSLTNLPLGSMQFYYKNYGQLVINKHFEIR
jgi:hypothetical protein